MPGLPFTLAILFSVPVTEAAFLSAARAKPPTDYLRGMLGRRSAEEVWGADDGYQRVARAAARLSGQAKALGAEVIYDARRADLLRTTSQIDVVILCGHWRGDSVSQEDLIGDPDAIVAALHAASGRDGEILRDATADLPPCSPETDRSWRRELARRLNQLIVSSAFNEALGLSDRHEREAIGAALARAVIDDRLGPMIAPGNRLELADGLFDEAEVEKAVAPKFHGELDLSVCQSVYLARFLGNCRADQKPRPIFHHGLSFLVPTARFTVLGDVLALCAEASVPFHEARAKVEAALVESFRQLHNQQGRKLWAWPPYWISTMFRALSSGSKTDRSSKPR